MKCDKNIFMEEIGRYEYSKHVVSTRWCKKTIPLRKQSNFCGSDLPIKKSLAGAMLISR